MKILLTTFVIAVSPAIAFAGCSGHATNEATMSCAEGMTYDAETQSCVPQTTS